MLILPLQNVLLNILNANSCPWNAFTVNKCGYVINTNIPALLSVLKLCRLYADRSKWYTKQTQGKWKPLCALNRPFSWPRVSCHMLDFHAWPAQVVLDPGIRICEMCHNLTEHSIVETWKTDCIISFLYGVREQAEGR